MKYLLILIIAFSALQVPAATEVQKQALTTSENLDKNLSSEDMKVLEEGEISKFRHLTGGLLSVYPGFGLGHVVEGRYLEKGWIFTLGESASAVVAIIGLGEMGITSALSGTSANAGSDKMLLGALCFMGFKIWEVVDAFAGPSKHNDRYRELNKRTSKSLTFEPVFSSNSTGGASLMGRWTF